MSPEVPSLRALPPAMRIVLHTTASSASDWRAALVSALPDAEIMLWPDVGSDVDYVVAWKPPAELFTRLPGVKAIFNLGAGVDALLRLPTLPANVPIVRLEDTGMAEQMVEYVTIAVLAAYREHMSYARQQRESRWQPRSRLAKSSFGVGILGLGVLGQAICAALAPWGFPLHGWSRAHKAVAGIRSYAVLDYLPAFLAQSRVLVCLLPSTTDTLDLLDRKRLMQLPRGAHLVNIARGEIVVDNDLIQLLDDGHLESATLDVFRDEPLPSTHPFWHHPKIIVTPHVSAMTLIEDSVAQVTAKIRRLEQGLAVTGTVDRARGY